LVVSKKSVIFVIEKENNKTTTIMKLTFENNVSDTIKKVVEELILNNKETNGNITVEYIPEDEVEDYDLPKSMTQNADEIYNVTQCVCGSWEQSLTMVAVTY
jgi:hypothetical protein